MMKRQTAARRTPQPASRTGTSSPHCHSPGRISRMGKAKESRKPVTSSHAKVKSPRSPPQKMFVGNFVQQHAATPTLVLPSPAVKPPSTIKHPFVAGSHKAAQQHISAPSQVQIGGSYLPPRTLSAPRRQVPSFLRTQR